ncbi:MAG: hypothetical protein AAF514_06450, partial [Verrucomicrobiota bacterium]
MASLKVEAVPSFPGAEGRGAGTAGGRGGVVLHVTHLNDGGPGSFREAVEANGARTVVFDVGGTIHLETPLVVSHPWITIAGQTAPEPGITLRLSDAVDDATLEVAASEVILRHLRIRPGPGAGFTGQRDGLRVGKPVGGSIIRNIVIDHCSVSWAVDENVSFAPGVQDLTIQWCLISEGLRLARHLDNLNGQQPGGHSKGLLSLGEENGYFSIHHNLFAHNSDRNPYLVNEGGTVSDIINNLLYNNLHHIRIGNRLGATRGNLIGNYIEAGPWTMPQHNQRLASLKLPIELESGVEAFVHDNLWKRDFYSSDLFRRASSQTRGGALLAQPTEPLALSVDDPATAREAVLNHAGASRVRRLSDGSLVSYHDLIDSRILQDVTAGTGRLIDHPDEVGGWMAGGPVEAADFDLDRDGMGDAWEINRFGHLDRGSPVDSSGDLDGDGFTDLEEYLNGTEPDEVDASEPPSYVPTVLPLPEDPGPVVLTFEAEAFSARTNAAGYSWEVCEGEGALASGGFVHGTPRALVLLDAEVEPALPELSYRLDFPKAATYFVWLRVRAPDNDSNAVTVGLNGQQAYPVDFALGKTPWHWKRGIVSVPSAGPHVFNLWMREPGAWIDRVVLTTEDSAEEPFQRLLEDRPTT